VKQPTNLDDPLAVAVEQLVEGEEGGEGTVLDGDRFPLVAVVVGMLVELARITVGEG